MSIATDSNNVPYIAYQDIGNENRVSVSKYNGTAAKKESSLAAVIEAASKFSRN